MLAFSLLDEEHVASWLGRSKKKHASCELGGSRPLWGHGALCSAWGGGWDGGGQLSVPLCLPRVGAERAAAPGVLRLGLSVGLRCRDVLWALPLPPVCGLLGLGSWFAAPRGSGPGAELPPPPSAWPPSLLAFLSTLLELAAYALLLYWSVQHFGLEIDWEKKVLESKVGTSRPHRVAVPVPVPVPIRSHGCHHQP